MRAQKRARTRLAVVARLGSPGGADFFRGRKVRREIRQRSCGFAFLGKVAGMSSLRGLQFVPWREQTANGGKRTANVCSSVPEVVFQTNRYLYK